jgi:membrane protein DedA with SNARE-associated domain
VEWLDLESMRIVLGVAIGLAIVGGTLGAYSLVLYSRRTGDKTIWRRWWAPDSILEKAELRLNRAGVFFLIAATVLMLLLVARIVTY